MQTLLHPKEEPLQAIGMNFSPSSSVESRKLNESTSVILPVSSLAYLEDKHLQIGTPIVVSLNFFDQEMMMYATVDEFSAQSGTIYVPDCIDRNRISDGSLCEVAIAEIPKCTALELQPIEESFFTKDFDRKVILEEALSHLKVLSVGLMIQAEGHTLEVRSFEPVGPAALAHECDTEISFYFPPPPEEQTGRTLGRGGEPSTPWASLHSSRWKKAAAD